MLKIISWIKEFLFALIAYENPLNYCKDRLGLLKEGVEFELVVRKGPKYILRAQESDIRILDEIWRRKVYDPVLKYVNPDSTVIDIGAQIGIFTIKAAIHAPRVKVISYEPFPRNFTALEKNIALNSLHLVRAWQYAVAATRGNAKFFFGKNDSGGGSLYTDQNEKNLQEIVVPTVVLEDIFRDNGIKKCEVLKIDCEGGEVPILTSAPRELFARIHSMVIEWHNDLSPMQLKDFLVFLKEIGYSTKFDARSGTIYAVR